MRETTEGRQAGLPNVFCFNITSAQNCRFAKMYWRLSLLRALQPVRAGRRAHGRLRGAAWLASAAPVTCAPVHRRRRSEARPPQLSTLPCARS